MPEASEADNIGFRVVRRSLEDIGANTIIFPENVYICKLKSTQNSLLISPNLKHYSDEELMKSFQQAGDIGYLGELYDRYIHLVFGVCMKYLKNKDDSKDMTMQVFEKLTKSAKETEIKSFKSWLHVVVKNECLMLLRSRKYKFEKSGREIKSGDTMDLAYSLHPNDEEEKEQNLQELEFAIEELPPEQKQCIRLFYLEQKCYKEIEEITGFELNKVKSYIQNGKRNLKIYLQKLNEQP